MKVAVGGGDGLEEPAGRPDTAGPVATREITAMSARHFLLFLFGALIAAVPSSAGILEGNCRRGQSARRHAADPLLRGGPDDPAGPTTLFSVNNASAKSGPRPGGAVDRLGRPDPRLRRLPDRLRRPDAQPARPLRRQAAADRAGDEQLRLALGDGHPLRRLRQHRRGRRLAAARRHRRGLAPRRPYRPAGGDGAHRPVRRQRRRRAPTWRPATSPSTR